MRKIHNNFRKKLNVTLLYFLIFSIIFASLGLYLGTKKPAIKQRFIRFDNFPQSIDSLKIVVLADVHIDATTSIEKVKYLINKSNSLNPDIVFLAGDIVDYQLKFIKDKAALLKNLKSKYGVFRVSGNHEFLVDKQDWDIFFDELGITMLDDKYVNILDNQVTLIGSSYLKDNQMPDMAKILENAPPDSFKIFLSHAPRVALEAKNHNIDLQLSGHTHGGLILGLNFFIKVLNSGFVSGVYNVGDMKLFVSNGTAIWNGFPIRFMVTSDIDYIILTK